MSGIPLGVLDLVPIPSGATTAQALRNTIDLARQAERFGYARYWFAEHHLNPGVAGASLAVVLALTASATSTIRIGSGAVQLGHRTALSTVEEFGMIDALHPGRLDLALGRRPVVPQHPHCRGRHPLPDPGPGPRPRLDRSGPRLVADRVDNQFIGSPGRVADQLEQLQQATGADELIITTITHDHADRVRSYRLLAEEWQRR